MRLHYNGDPNSTLNQVYSAQKAEYDKVYRPINQEMIASADSTEMVDSAKANANSGFDGAKARESRMAGRYGISYNPIQQKEINHRNSAAKSLNYDDVVNRSRLSQYDRNTQVMNDMISVGRGIDNSANQQLIQAANLQTQRENNNANISAQNDAAQTQMMGSLASAGIMALAFM